MTPHDAVANGQALFPRLSREGGKPDRGQALRVLLIDENPVFMHAATAFLQRQAGFVTLRTAATLEAALVGARDFRPAVIVIDPNNASMEGLAIIPRIRTVLPQVGIVVLALIDSPTYRDASIANGADCFVSKSSMAADLLPAIHRAVRGKGWPSPAAAAQRVRAMAA